MNAPNQYTLPTIDFVAGSTQDFSFHCYFHADKRPHDLYSCTASFAIVKVEKAEATLNERIDKTDEIVAAKADNIVFNEEDSTIQLVSTIPVVDDEGNIVEFRQVPLGDPIFVRADTARNISNMEINEDGDLIATFDDDEVQNLGHVVGKDGVVYVPHVDDHRVLTFTIETEPGEIPEPVDLNPNDEWSDMDDGGMDSSSGKTDYVWEDM